MSNPISVATEAAVKRAVQDQAVAGLVAGLLSVVIQLSLLVGLILGIFSVTLGLFIYALYDIEETHKVMEILAR